MSAYSPYLSGLTRSEATHYIQNLDIPHDEKERMFQAAKRQPKNHINAEQAARQRAAREALENRYIKALVDYLIQHPGAGRAETMEALKINGQRFFSTIRLAEERGMIVKNKVDGRRYEFFASGS